MTHLITIKHGTEDLPDYSIMNWLDVETAPFDRDLELAVIDFDGAHPLVFPCRRVLGGWVRAATNTPVRVHPTHWREWNNKIGSPH
jgi:hypothetical protein